MYELLGICLMLAALLIINALMTLASVALWKLMSRRSQRWEAATRARFLFVLRVFPAAASIACVFTLLAPAYLIHEPRPPKEVVTFKLALLASLSLVALVLALWRGLTAWWATRRLLNDWMRDAESIQLDGVWIPAYRIEHCFPVIAVVGFIRPRLFIAGHLLDSLDAGELRAALMHERAHLIARDNFKRMVMRVCCDALAIVPGGRSLSRAWYQSSEVAADEYAASLGGKRTALALAAALVKIARLVPVGAKPTLPAGAFLAGDQEGADVERRVRRLAHLATPDVTHAPSDRASRSVMRWTVFSVSLPVLILAVNSKRALATVHQIMENMVSLLQ